MWMICVRLITLPDLVIEVGHLTHNYVVLQPKVIKPRHVSNFDII